MSYVVGDAKRFLKDKANLTISLVTCLLITNIAVMSLIVVNTNKIIKKINHRYFNITTTLEDIHQVNVDTLNGSVRR